MNLHSIFFALNSYWISFYSRTNRLHRSKDRRFCTRGYIRQIVEVKVGEKRAQWINFCPIFEWFSVFSEILGDYLGDLSLMCGFGGEIGLIRTVRHCVKSFLRSVKVASSQRPGGSVMDYSVVFGAPIRLGRTPPRLLGTLKSTKRNRIHQHTLCKTHFTPR